MARPRCAAPRAARQGPAFLRDDIGARKNKYIFLAAPLPLFVPWKEKVFLLEMLSLSAWIHQQGWEQRVLPSSHQFPSSHHFPHWKRLFPVLLKFQAMPGPPDVHLTVRLGLCQRH